MLQNDTTRLKCKRKMALKYGVIVPGVLYALLMAFVVYLWIYNIYTGKTSLQESLTNIILGVILGLIVMVVPVTYITNIQAKKVIAIGEQFREYEHWWLLYASLCLILCTIFLGLYDNLIVSLDYDTITFMLFMLLLPLTAISYMTRDQADFGKAISPYALALLDISDGIEMAVTKLIPTNRVWVQIVICFAIIMFYVTSFLEIYHVRFPELRNGWIFSERRIRRAQLVFSCIFLVLRVALLVYNPQELVIGVFIVKSGVLLIYRYQKLSNLQFKQDSRKYYRISTYVWTRQAE